MNKILRLFLFSVVFSLAYASCFGQCTVTLTSSPSSVAQTLCRGSAIVPIVYTTTGANGIGSTSSLPNGVTANWASNTITISGTPTVSGTFNYSIPLTGGGCGAVNATGTINVTPNNTISLSSSAGSNAQTRCINSAITNITYATTGATGGTVSGLPAGVTGSWASNVFTISGTPSVSGIFNYIVTMTGGCTGGSNTALGSITVSPNNTIALTSVSGTNAQTRCINSAISNITYATTTATGATFSGLPAGVSGAWASNVATISGTPSASGTFDYTVTLTGGCGTVTATGSITVTPNNTAGTASSNPTVCINTALTAITRTTTGATGIGTATGLPAGVTAAWAANVLTISGTPTAAGIFAYTIPLTGGCGAVNATGSITVTPANTFALSSAAGTDAQTRCINTAITSITYSTTTATGATFSGLPAGVTGAWASNVATISGTPTASGTFNYTVTLTGGCGTVTANGSIVVTPNNTATLSSAAGTDAQTQCINTAITHITYATTTATGATFSGLPAGVTGVWASNVATISGTPTASGTFNYTVTLTGGCGTITAAGSIIVTQNNTAGAASSTPTLCINTALTAISHTTTGATGIGTATGLPSGVTATWAAGVLTISGTPAASGTFNYSIGLSGGCGSVNATGTIIVNPASDSNTISVSENTVCSALSPFTNTVTLSASSESVGIKTWQYSSDNATFTDILNSNVSSYVLNNLVTDSGSEHIPVTHYYRLKTVSGVCPADTSLSLSILIKPRPYAVNGAYSICSGENFGFTPLDDANTIIPNNTTLDYVAVGQGNITGFNSLNNQSSISAELVNLDYMNNSVVYSVTPYYEECEGSEFQIEVTVLRHPEIISSGDESICEGESVQLFAVDLFNSPGTYFDWTNGDEESLNFAFISNPIAQPDTSTEYIVSMRDPINTACYAYDTTNVYVNSIPVFDIVEPDGIFCTGNFYNFNVTNQAGFNQLIWEVSNALIVNSDNSQLTLSLENSGVVGISAEAITTDGCSYTDSIQFSAGQTPEADISGPSIVCANSVYQLYEGSSQFGNGLTWTIENGAITNGQGTPNAEVSWFTGNEGTVILTAHEWQSGCEASDSLVVSFEGEAPGIFAVEMLGQNSTVLLCSNSSFPYYRWGYTLASTGVETTFNSNAPYFEYNQIDVINYYYWVEYGAVDGCVTRSYFNAPPIVTSVQEEDSLTDVDFIVFPNPVSDVLTISTKNWIRNAKVEVLTSTGVLLDSKLYSGVTMPLDFSIYASGIYWVKLTTSNSVQVLTIVKR